MPRRCPPSWACSAPALASAPRRRRRVSERCKRCAGARLPRRMVVALTLDDARNARDPVRWLGCAAAVVPGRRTATRGRAAVDAGTHRRREHPAGCHHVRADDRGVRQARRWPAPSVGRRHAFCPQTIHRRRGVVLRPHASHGSVGAFGQVSNQVVMGPKAIFLRPPRGKRNPVPAPASTTAGRRVFRRPRDRAPTACLTRYPRGSARIALDALC